MSLEDNLKNYPNVREALADSTLPVPSKKLLRPLTVQQQLFVHYYMTEAKGNASRAAELVGVSKGSADWWMGDPSVQQEIARRGLLLAEASRIESREVVGTLLMQMRGDVVDIDACIDEAGRINRELAKETGVSRLIKGLKYDKETGRIVSLEAYSAQAAATQLSRILNLEKRGDTINVTLNSDQRRQAIFLVQEVKGLLELARSEGENPTPEEVFQVLAELEMTRYKEDIEPLKETVLSQIVASSQNDGVVED